MQEFAIRETIMKSRRGKFLTLGDLRIGIRFEKVWDAFRGQAKIDPSVSVES